MIPKSIFKLQEKSNLFYGQKFFQFVMKSLATELDIDFVLVGKHVSKSKEVQSIVYSKEADKFMALNYKLKATPCEIVSHKSYCVYENDVAQLFPEDLLLTEMEIKGYVGASFESNSSNIRGLLVALTQNKISNSNILGESVKMFTTRMANEFARDGLKVLDPISYQ